MARSAEPNASNPQEKARTEASIAIMSMATNSSAIQQISGKPLEAVISTLNSNPTNRRHSLMGLDFIGQLAEEDLTERVVDAGGMDAILIGMKTQLHDEEITRRSLDALAYLATDEEHLEHLIEVSMRSFARDSSPAVRSWTPSLRVCRRAQCQ